MPLVRIDIRKGKDAAYRTALGHAVHDALVAIGAPQDDRFQVIAEHDAAGLVYDPDYLGIHRTDDVVFVQITFNDTRTLEQKKALFKHIVENMARSPGVKPGDVLINLVEVKKENWSFGNGEMPYAT
ncbi:tautomerase family protein [Luteibacter yeojuensis]|uniref:4-oxalocrotonate tautomerase n=1 Tax=Luteibacter yeojuensis TaxID=345309 RepID=A0A0F3K6T2_9GAMM|nr:tautomerase family protein [Luteibacter yeojuensis]KJV26672.1 4-oxalocrotonate tautomerase [Luteibacter yeojuensis]